MNLKNLKPKEKRYTVKLGNSLFLRVHPSGVKSYVLRYNLKGTVKDVTLGHYPALTLMQARHLAETKRSELNIKPASFILFNDAFNLWKSKKKGHIKSYESEKARIKLHLLPHLKSTPLNQITAPLALNILLKLEGKLPTLKRILMRLNEILDLAVCAGLLDSNPCRRLSKIFANHQPRHRPYIPASKLSELFSALSPEKTYFHIYVLFCIYTALRPHESTIVKWSYIQNGVLTMPAQTMKKGRVHRVPITQKMYAVLKVCLRVRPKRSHFIFNFGRAGSLIHKQHLSRWLIKHGFKDRLCHHGLRATFRTWLHDQNVAHEIAEDAIAHLSLSQTERAYIRSDFLEQRRPIMQNWCDFILSLYCAHCADHDGAKPILTALAKFKD